MGKKVRDTIHGYIYLTKIDEAVSQHSLVLRMHHVHQTSFTYLTYPNAHSTRYPHSLGVMHVAGEIFLSAVANTPHRELLQLSQLVSGFIATHFKGRHAEIVAELIASQAGTSAEPIYQIPASAALTGENAYFNIVLLLQAVRLAALLHDVGHPPFSHIVEYGLLQACGEKYGGHEKVGSEILKVIQKDENLSKRFRKAKLSTLAEISLALCREILHSGEESGFIGIEKSLLSGPIDADRLDYVRRDAYAAGMVPSYDIRRMVDAAFFRTNNKGKLEVGYRPNCLSSFENFFFARYDLYRYMIYHHDVIRRNLAIQRLLAIILGAPSDIDPQIRKLGDRLVECATGKAKGGYEFYERFVDAYFLNMLWELDDLLSGSAIGLEPTAGRLKLYLDLVLRRQNDKLRTLFKRPDHYAAFAEGVLEGPGMPTAPEKTQSVPFFNDLLRGRLAAIKASKRRPGGADEISDSVAKLALAEAIEEKLNAAAAAASQPFTFYCYYLGTFSAGPGKKVLFSEPESTAGILAETVSPTIAMLEEAWNFSPQLVVFYHPQSGAGPVEDGAVSDILKPIAVAGLKSFLATS